MFKLAAVLALFLFSASVPVSGEDQQSVQELDMMKRADRLRHEGKLEQAAALITQILSRDGKNCEALENRGRIYYALGQYPKAMEDARRLVQLQPDRYSYVFRANIFLAQGKPEQAVLDLDRALKLKDSTGNLRRRAVANMLCGRARAARSDADAHWATMPRSAMSFELCSVADALSGLQDEAMAKLAQFTYVKLHRDSEANSSQYKKQGRYWAETHFPEGAMADSERDRLIARLEKDHLGLSPEHYYLARAIIYFYGRDYDRAMAESARCRSSKMQIYPDLLDCNCLLFKKDFPAAGERIIRLTALFPESENVLDALDAYHYETGERKKGTAEIKALLVKNPKNEAALVELAKIYHDLSQLSDAEKYCELALQLEPKRIDVLLMQANILTSQGNYPAALKVLTTITTLDHQSGAAYLARAAIHTQEGRLLDAVNDLTEAIRLRFDLSKSFKARAACYHALKRFDLEQRDFALLNESL